MLAAVQIRRILAVRYGFDARVRATVEANRTMAEVYNASKAAFAGTPA